MKLDKYYPVQKPSKNLYDKVYATIPIAVEENMSLFWIGVVTIIGSIIAPSYAFADMLSVADIDTVFTILYLYVGGE